MVNLVFDNPNNLSDFGNMLTYLNDLTDVGAGGMIGVIILLVVGFVLFFMMKAWSFNKAFPTASFILGIIAVFLRVMGLINNVVLGLVIVLVVYGIYELVRGAGDFES